MSQATTSQLSARTASGHGRAELIALTAFMMSLAALSIDMMLPALPQIGQELAVPNANDRQQVIVFFLLGNTLAQIIYGPLSDRFGRKPVVALGILIFLGGSLVSALAGSFSVMLAGRILQGVGVAAVRVLAVAIVRDQYAGVDMARIMSMAMSVFILVPCVAPLGGQLVLAVAEWRYIFIVFSLMAALLLCWFWLRQQETLTAENRRAFNLQTFIAGVKEICTNSTTIGYTLALGMISGVFSSYLMSSQQIFHEIYQAGDLFALYFAILALAVGAAGLLNSRIVVRFGMKALCQTATIGIALLCGILCAYSLITGVVVSLNIFLAVMIAVFFCIGFVFGNMNSVAMQPMGHIAGVATSVISLISGMVALVIGASLGAAFNQTIIPLTGGFTVASILALLVMRWADSQPYRSEGAGVSSVNA
ncbi:multidrug effflux MFS transporter [Spongorhabdus nitratireducens]